MPPWKRTFLVVWAANLVTSMGMMSFLPFFPNLLEELGVDGEARVRVWSGVLFGAAPFAATVMAPVWGALGDRVGRKVMICRALCAIALFVGGMAWAVGPWSLLALRLGQGFFSGFIPPSITLVSVQAPADRQGRVTSALTTGMAIGGMLGPLLGAWLAVRLGSHQRVFVAVGAAALFSALLVLLFAHEDRSTLLAVGPGAGLPRRSLVERVREAVGTLLRDLRRVLGEPALHGVVLLVFAAQFGLGAVNPVLERLVRALLDADQVGGGSRFLAWVERLGLAHPPDTAARVTLATGLCFGAMALANLVSLTPWGVLGDRIGHARALHRCAVLGLGALLVQGMAPDYDVLLLGRLLMGAAMAGVGPLAFGIAAGEVEAGRRGGAFGVVFSARTLAVAVGGVAGGNLAAALGVRSAIGLAAAVLGLGLLVFHRAGRTRAPSRDR